MVTQAHAYDHPNYIIRRLIAIGGGGAAASIVAAAFSAPVALKVHRVGAVAKVAGTSSTNTYTVREGTTSIGLLTLADSAALFVNTADLGGVTVEAGNVLNFLKGTDATGTADFWVEAAVNVGQALTI